MHSGKSKEYDGPASMRSYAGNDPINANDPMGLDVYIYRSRMLGLPGTNHLYVWSTETNTGRGRSGSSGWVRHTGVGDPEKDFGFPVEDLGGLTEQEFMSKVIAYPGWDRGIFFPGIDDCHTQLREAFEYAGAPYPEWPTGRVDWDEQIGTAANNVIDKGRQLWQKTKGYFGKDDSSAGGGSLVYPGNSGTNIVESVCYK
jgi:hypothetical protein